MKQLLPIRHLLLLAGMLIFFAACTEDKINLDGTGTIKGRVMDESDLTPVENAEITTNPPSHIVLTDSLGYFELEDVKVGDYNVIAKQKDYFSSTSAVKVNLNSVTQVVINLNQRLTDEGLPVFSPNYYPGDEQSDVSVNTVFGWQMKNPKDSATFELKIFESGQPLTIHLENITDTFAIVKGLKFSTTYLWQLSAHNASGHTYTEVRTFSTHNFPKDFLLYARRVNDVSQIFVTDTVAQSHIQLTHNNYHSWRPVANATKNRIAFLSTKDISPQLYVMKPDGSDVVRLTHIATGGYYNKGVGFAWLPNGEQLIFSAYNKLYVINKDGSGLREVAGIDNGRHFREVDWCPVNNRIVALTLGTGRYDAEIVVMNTVGKNMQVLVSDKQGAIENPVFSIDGKKILYTYDVSDFQSPSGRQLDSRIFEYDLQSGTTRAMSTHKPNGTNDMMPVYTSNGAGVIFVNAQNTLDARRDLWIMRSDSTHSQHRRLLIQDVEAPDW